MVEKKSVDIIAYEDMLADKEIMELDGSDKRKKVLEKVYSKRKVIATHELKGMLYFVVEG